MTVQVVVTGANANEAAQEMANFLAATGKAYVAFTAGKTPAPSAPANDAAKPEAKAETAAAPAKDEAKAEPTKEETAGKKKKAAAPKLADDKGDDVEVTLEGCRTMAMRVAASDGKEGQAGGITKANKIIESFGVAKLGDIPEARFQEFIDECQKALDAAKAAPASMF